MANEEARAVFFFFARSPPAVVLGQRAHANQSGGKSIWRANIDRHQNKEMQEQGIRRDATYLEWQWMGERERKKKRRRGEEEGNEEKLVMELVWSRV